MKMGSRTFRFCTPVFGGNGGYVTYRFTDSRRTHSNMKVYTDEKGQYIVSRKEKYYLADVYAQLKAEGKEVK